MLNDKQLERLLGKMERFIDQLEPHIFVKVGELENVEKCVWMDVCNCRYGCNQRED